MNPPGNDSPWRFRLRRSKDGARGGRPRRFLAAFCNESLRNRTHVVEAGERVKKTDGIYEEYASLIYKYLYRLTGGNGDLSEELTQEVFYQALRTVNRFQGDSKMSTWLCQIAKHCWYQYLEKQRRERHACLEDIPDIIVEDANPESFVMDADNRVFLYKQVHLLREPYREVVMLRVLGELSFSEIATIMEKTESWARVTFHRAKMILIERGKQNGSEM